MAIKAIQFTALSFKFTMKNCLIFFKTETLPKHWILEKTNILEFSLKDKVNMLWQMPKTALFFLKEEKQIELPDKQGRIFTLQDHILFFKF